MTVSTMKVAKRAAQKEADRIAGQALAPEGARCIALTQGRISFVDEADYDCLAVHHWHLTTRGYAATRTSNRVVLMHRMILDVGASQRVDHASGDKLDNRRQNLRVATSQQNSFNTRSHGDSASRFKGVTWKAGRGVWQARICISGRSRYLGAFSDEAEAAKAYDRAASELMGEFAKLNTPKESWA